MYMNEHLQIVYSCRHITTILLGPGGYILCAWCTYIGIRGPSLILLAGFRPHVFKQQQVTHTVNRNLHNLLHNVCHVCMMYIVYTCIHEYKEEPYSTRIIESLPDLHSDSLVTNCQCLQFEINPYRTMTNMRQTSLTTRTNSYIHAHTTIKVCLIKCLQI